MIDPVAYLLIWNVLCIYYVDESSVPSYSSPLLLFCVEGRRWVSRFRMQKWKSISRWNASDGYLNLEWFCGISRQFLDLKMLLWHERFITDDCTLVFDDMYFNKSVFGYLNASGHAVVFVVMRLVFSLLISILPTGYRCSVSLSASPVMPTVNC